jgi:hypothetical protein
MATSIIAAGGAGTPGLQTTGGDDGTLTIKAGPVSAQVDSIKISEIGAIDLRSALNVQLPGIGINQIKVGTGDGATQATYNVNFKLHYGLAFSDHTDTVRAWYSSRDGNFTVTGAFNGPLNGNATTATTSTFLSHSGGSGIYSTTYGASYSQAVCVREYNAAGAQGGAMAAAPRLGFHWGSTVASSIAMEVSGRIGIYNNPGTSYENFAANNIYGAGNITAYSDERVKTNWRSVGYDFVSNLALVKSGIYDRTDVELTQVGVSAQSLQKFMPDAVIEDHDGALSVSYGNAAMLSAVELAKEVIDLRARVAKLETALELLINRN